VPGIGSSNERFQPRSATMVDGLAEPLHCEFDVVRLEVAPALDFGEVMVLRKPLKVFRGEPSGGVTQSGELFADVRVSGHAPLKRGQSGRANYSIGADRAYQTLVPKKRPQPGDGLRPSCGSDCVPSGNNKRHRIVIQNAATRSPSSVLVPSAGSTGRRNTGIKSFCWGFKLQGLTWSFV
jgi:hypothetical protein